MKEFADIFPFNVSLLPEAKNNSGSLKDLFFLTCTIFYCIWTSFSKPHTPFFSPSWYLWNHAMPSPCVPPLHIWPLPVYGTVARPEDELEEPGDA